MSGAGQTPHESRNSDEPGRITSYHEHPGDLSTPTKVAGQLLRLSLGVRVHRSTPRGTGAGWVCSRKAWALSAARTAPSATGHGRDRVGC